MSQTIHLQKLHLQEMEMVFLWMWLVSLMIRWMGFPCSRITQYLSAGSRS